MKQKLTDATMAIVGVFVLGMGIISPTLIKIILSLETDENLLKLLLEHKSYLTSNNYSNILKYVREKRSNVYMRWEKLLVLS